MNAPETNDYNLEKFIINWTQLCIQTEADFIRLAQNENLVEWKLFKTKITNKKVLN